MHEYYRQNRKKIRKRMNGYLRLIAPEIEKIFAVPYRQAFEEVWALYESDMLEMLPYIGGDDVSGTGNLTGCTFFIAFGIAAERHGLSTHEWGYLSTVMYQRYFERIPKPLRRLLGRTAQNHPAFIAKLLRKRDAKNRANAKANPGSFVTETQDGSEKYPVVYHTLVCPVHEFCKEHDLMAYLPYLCNLDYVMFAAFSIPLIREKTCSTGDGVCDFKICPSSPVPDVWPPHILDESDPLK